MHDKAIKKWTILIYADGNNEMEKVMYNSLLACEKIGSNNEVNVVFQIGKLGNYKSNEKANWFGVRRYYVDRGSSTLIEDLGKSNMADPNNLYDFIKWGFEKYKSEHYMLVISGHGGDFIGCLTDISLEKPYIMGIPEMFQAVNTVRKNLGYELDILLLDLCHMNTIEVIYELAREKRNTAKTIITYMDYAAYDGIDYTLLLSFIVKNSSVKNLKLFIKMLIENFELNFQAFKVNNKKMEKIKQLFDKLANQEPNALALVNNRLPQDFPSDYIKKIDKVLNSILIYSRQTFKGLNINIRVTCSDVKGLILFYNKLAFSKNNHWTDLLSNIPLDNSKTLPDRVKVALSPSSEPLIHYILKFN
jgi:hypothetical protein